MRKLHEWQAVQTPDMKLASIHQEGNSLVMTISITP
jgi:hypothetical protein